MGALTEAFVEGDSALAAGLRERCTTSHWDPMLGSQEALDCKLERSAYVGRVIEADGARVLDFGSGMGFLACYLAAHGAREVVGVEVLDEHRQASAYLAESVFRAPNARFVKTTDELEEGSFDAVVLANVVSHVYDPCRVLVRLADLLAPGGRLFVEDNNNLSSPIVRRRLPGMWAREEANYREKRVAELGRRAADAYGLSFEQTRFWADRGLSRVAGLRRHAPLDPDYLIYHENAFRPDELVTIVFNCGLAVQWVRPKSVFDFKRNSVVSRLFERFPRLGLHVAPAFEILSVKR